MVHETGLTLPSKSDVLARDLAPDPRLDALVADVGPFVSPPEVYLRVNDLLRSDTTTARDFANVVATDPSLAMRVLRVANSPYFGLRHRVDTISRAVAVLGIRELYSLVLAVSAVSSFSSLDTSLVNMRSFWRHGVLTGLLSRRLAERCSVLQPERLFVVGLLHDVGHLVLFHRIPEVMSDVLLAACGNETSLHRLEHDTLGFGHADVAARLAGAWHLPDSLTDAIAQHHHGTRDDGSLDARIVGLADAIANRSDLGALYELPDDRDEPEEILSLAESLELEDADLDAAYAGATEEFVDTVQALTA